MSNYDEMSLDDLKKLKEQREADKLRMELKSEDEAVACKEKDEYEQAIKEQAIKDYLNKNPPKSKISEPIVEKKDDSPNLESYQKTLDAIVQATGQTELFEYTREWHDPSNSDCAGHDFDALRKEDVFIKGVWHALYCRANLLQYAVKGININAGDGLDVQIRTVGKFSLDPEERSSCSCLDCGNVAFDSYNICIKQFGLKTEICAFDIFDVGETLRTEIIKTMGYKWGEWLDQEIYNMLIGATSDIKCGDESLCTTFDTALSCDISCATCTEMAADCCEIPGAVALYNAIIDTEAAMREDNRSPKVVILSPSIAALFKYASGTDLPSYIRNNIVVKNNILTKIGSLDVLETCVANTMSDVSAVASAVVAVIIDPSRAFGFAMGKRPSMEKDRNISCNSTTYAMWAYLGGAILDCEAIARITQPAVL